MIGLLHFAMKYQGNRAHLYMKLVPVVQLILSL